MLSVILICLYIDYVYCFILAYCMVAITLDFHEYEQVYLRNLKVCILVYIIYQDGGKYSFELEISIKFWWDIIVFVNNTFILDDGQKAARQVSKKSKRAQTQCNEAATSCSVEHGRAKLGALVNAVCHSLINFHVDLILLFSYQIYNIFIPLWMLFSIAARCVCVQIYLTIDVVFIFQNLVIIDLHAFCFSLAS